MIARTLSAVKFAPRIDACLIEALATLDDPCQPVAETRRRLGALAESLDLPRPSYERVRQLVAEHRQWSGRPSRVAALADLAWNTRRPEQVFYDLVSGDGE